MTPHQTSECCPETCGGVDYDPCRDAVAYERGIRAGREQAANAIQADPFWTGARAARDYAAALARSWRCAAHGITTSGDCPRCDDELIELADSDTGGAP